MVYHAIPVSAPLFLPEGHGPVWQPAMFRGCQHSPRRAVSHGTGAVGITLGELG